MNEGVHVKPNVLDGSLILLYNKSCRNTVKILPYLLEILSFWRAKHEKHGFSRGRLGAIQLKSLSQLELGEYLSLIVSKLQSVIQQSNQDKLISNKMIFGTIIRQIPEQLNIENQSTFQSLKNLYDEFENEIIKQ